MLLEAECPWLLAAPAACHAQLRLRPRVQASLLHQTLSSPRPPRRAVWGREDGSPGQAPEPPRPGLPAARAVPLSQARGVHHLPTDWVACVCRRGGRGKTDQRPALSGGGRRGLGSACPVTDTRCHRHVTPHVTAAEPGTSVWVTELAFSAFGL